MTLDELVADGWQRHAQEPETVLRQLAQQVGLVSEPGHLAPFAGLVTHVAGEHLGRFEEGLALLSRLERLPWFQPSAPEARSVARSRAALELAAGDESAAERSLAAGLGPGATAPASDRVRALATAASALAARGRTAEAGRALERALHEVGPAPRADDPAVRALAVTGNNLAVELENRAARTPAEDGLMVRAAELGLTYWSLCGGWEQRQAAHYRLSHALRKAGRAAEAREQALRCQALVASHGAPPAESLFAFEALAHAQLALGERAAAHAARDAARALLPALADEGWREAATTDLEALDAALRAAPPAPPQAPGTPPGPPR